MVLDSVVVSHLSLARHVLHDLLLLILDNRLLVGHVFDSRLTSYRLTNKFEIYLGCHRLSNNRLSNHRLGNDGLGHDWLGSVSDRGHIRLSYRRGLDGNSVLSLAGISYRRDLWKKSAVVNRLRSMVHGSASTRTLWLIRGIAGFWW